MSGKDPVTVLAVAGATTLAQLRRILSHTRWTLVEAPTIRQGLTVLRRAGSAVVIAEAILPDGSWRELLRRTRRLPRRPPVIVAAPQGDDGLWMEVLKRGAYPLPVEPLHDQDLFQVVSQAWLHLRDVATSPAMS